MPYIDDLDADEFDGVVSTANKPRNLHSVPEAFTKEELAEFEALMSAPLDYELRALRNQEKNGGYIHTSLKDEIDAEVRRLKESGLLK